MSHRSAGVPPAAPSYDARPNRYRLVAFDFDGTLADSFGWFVGIMGEVATKYRLRPIDDVDLETLRAYTGRQLLAHLRLPRWKLPFVAAHVRKLQARDIGQIALFDGIGEMLGALASRGITIAVVSSNAEQNVHRVLGRDIASLISYYGCGASLFGKARVLRAALRASGVAPNDAIYVGDEARDIEAARGVGMDAGAVSWGYAAPAALRAMRPSDVFDNPRDIVARLA